MDLEKESSDTSAVEESDNGSKALLSDFEDSDEENIEDDYFRQYVDVGVGDVLYEVVGSSQFMIVETDQAEQINAAEVREEDILVMLSDYEYEEIEEVDGMSDDEDEIVVQEKHTKYNPSEMCKEFQFELGMDFTSLG